MKFIECMDAIGSNKVFINPNNVDFVAEVLEDQFIEVQVANGTKQKVTIPKGSFNVQLTSGRGISITKESGDKLLTYLPPPLYTLDAKTLFNYDPKQLAQES